MSNAITKYIRGSCPVFNAGQTITVKYVSKDFNPVSMVCECESDCTLRPCPIKRAILSMVDWSLALLFKTYSDLSPGL